MENVTLSISLSYHGQPLSDAHSLPSSSLVTSKMSSSSSMNSITYSSSPPSPVSTSAITRVSSSSSDNSSILNLPVTANASNWNSAVPSNFSIENATSAVEHRFPAGGIAGIVVGGFAFLVIVVVVVVYLCRTHCRRSEIFRNGCKCQLSNRRNYEVSQIPIKASSPKKAWSVNMYSDSTISRTTTRANSLANEEQDAKCCISPTDTVEIPPPVPRRDPNLGKDCSNRQQPGNTMACVSQSEVSVCTEAEGESDRWECFPDELPPPPPRDSIFVLDS